MSTASTTNKTDDAITNDATAMSCIQLDCTSLDSSRNCTILERASQNSIFGMGIITVDQVAGHVAAAVTGAIIAVVASIDE